MNANDALLDKSTDRAAWVDRFKNGQAEKIVRTASKADREIKKEILVTDQLKTKKDVKSLVKKIREIEQEYSEKYEGDLTNELKDFAEDQAESETKTMGKTLAAYAGLKLLFQTPEKEKLWKDVVNKQMTKSGSGPQGFNEMMGSVKTSRLNNIETEINKGFALGQDSKEIANQIYGPTGTINKSNNWAKTVAITLTGHTSSATKLSVAAVNNGLVQGYTWNSVMDGRTTVICAGLNGKYWLYDNPAESTLSDPMVPPAHEGCRSDTVPIFGKLAKFIAAGATILSGSKIGKKQASKNMDGKPPKEPSFSEWFNGKPESFQKEWLGDTRFEAWKDGKLKLNDLVKNNKPLTLEELKIKTKEA